MRDWLGLSSIPSFSRRALSFSTLCSSDNATAFFARLKCKKKIAELITIGKHMSLPHLLLVHSVSLHKTILIQRCTWFLHPQIRAFVGRPGNHYAYTYACFYFRKTLLKYCSSISCNRITIYYRVKNLGRFIKVMSYSIPLGITLWHVEKHLCLQNHQIHKTVLIYRFHSKGIHKSECPRL